MIAEPLIQLNKVTKSFSPTLPPALADCSASLPAGKITGLIGADGAGKTTLIRLMAALLLPTTGEITVAHKNTKNEGEAIHNFIGYMPQKFGLYEDLTVIQNLRLYADLRGLPPPQRERRFNELFHFTGLGPFQSRSAYALSGGMKQKLGLACALITKPKLLLLDEPSVGVDPISRRELWQMVYQLVTEGISVIWSTSYLDEAEKCDRLLFLNEGKLLFEGTPEELIKGHASVEEAFTELLGNVALEPSKLAALAPQVTGDNPHVIQVENVTKKFGSFTAVNKTSFNVARGELFGLLGPNGAGKSTIFKMLCGLLRPTEGKTTINGFDLQKAPSVARAQIGYMAQKFSLYTNLTVLQNLQFFAGIYNLEGKKKEQMIQTMIEIFDLQRFLDTSTEILSLGYKQRLSLACATLHSPPILFLDEPTSGVDPITRREFWNHIHGLVDKGVTVMVTTHFMIEAENCDRIALIYQGKIIHIDTPEKLKEKGASVQNPHPTLEQAFITLIENYHE